MNIFDPLWGDVESLPTLSLVNASAGTGKTWTVTHLAARWLLEIDGRDPSNVLLVTFARDAASELKSRLREKIGEFADEIELIGAGGELDDKTPPRDWRRHFRNIVDVQGVPVLRRRCRDILRNLDGVNARTIHSFSSLIQAKDDVISDRSSEFRQRAARETMIWMAEHDGSALTNLLDHVSTTGDQVNRLVDQIAGTLQLVLPMGGITNDPEPLVRFANLPMANSISDEVDPLRAKAMETFVKLVVKAQEFEARLRTLERSSSFDAIIGDLVTEVRNDIDSVRRRMGNQFQLVIIDEFQDTDAGQWEIFSSLFLDGPTKAPVLVVGDAKQAIYSFRGGDVTVMQRIQDLVNDDARMQTTSLTTNHRSHSGLLSQLNDFYSPDEAPHVFVPSETELSAIRYETIESPVRLADGRGLFTLRDLRGVTFEGDNKEALRKDVLLEIQRLTSGELEARERPLHGEQWTYSDIVILCRTKGFLRLLQRDLERHHIPYVTPRTISVFSSLAASEVRWLLWALSDPSDPRRWRSLAASWFSHLVNQSDGPVEIGRLVERKGVAVLHRIAMNGNFMQSLLTHPGGQRHITDVDHIFTTLADEFPTLGGITELSAWIEMAIGESDAQSDGVDGQRRIESDENAVRLMTIHAAKGMEFPVVLLPDVETMGKPQLVLSTNGAHGKTIDAESVLLESSERSVRTRMSVTQENDRLIYVALTRAKIVLVAWVNDEVTPERKPAWFALTEPWIEVDRPGGPRVIRIEETELREASIQRGARNAEHLSNVTVLEQHRSPREQPRRWSYSSLHLHLDSTTDGDVDSKSLTEDDGSGEGDARRQRRGYYAFGQLRGTELGDALHASFEDTVGRVGANDEERLMSILNQNFSSQGLALPNGILAVFQALLTRPLGGPWGEASLDSYASSMTAVSSEMRFTIPLGDPDEFSEADVLTSLGELVTTHDPTGPFVQHFSSLASQPSPGRLAQGYLSGSIDLVAPTLGASRRFMVLDYKSNALTVTNDFTEESLIIEMAASGYPLQALIYSVALHRHLSARLSKYRPDDDLGGATYYYLRGAGLPDAAPSEGAVHWAIPSELTVKVSALLRGEHS